MDINKIFELLRKYRINDIDNLINCITILGKPKYGYSNNVLISTYNVLINTLKENMDFIRLQYTDYDFYEYCKSIKSIEEYLDSIKIIFCLTQ